MNQEKRIDTTFKNFIDSKSMSKEMCMYGLCKVHKQEVDDCPTPPPPLPPPLFSLILSVLPSPSYNLSKLLVPTLNSLTKNEETVKDSFYFADEI